MKRLLGLGTLFALVLPAVALASSSESGEEEKFNPASEWTLHEWSSFSAIAVATASKSKSPRSSAMRDWKTTWKSTSPSSSRTASGSPRAIASASS